MSSDKENKTHKGKKTGSSDNVIQTLGDNLSDEFLTRVLPGLSPPTTREYLRQVSSFLDLHGFQFVQPEQENASLPFMKQGMGSTLKLFTDGASRGNPGKAGAGVVIVDESGEEIFALGKYLGQCTNNMAEYQALIIGLKEARQFDPAELQIYLDSELIVKQIKGQYRVKDDKLKPLFSQVQNALSSFNKWAISHVPRAQNKRADQLANEGIDEAFG